MRIVFVVALVALASLTGACARGTPPGHPFPVSSVRSDYSPVVRLPVRIETRADSIIVSTDSGEVVAPGEVPPNPKALMRALHIEALVVRTGAAALTRRAEGGPIDLPTPWFPMAESDPLPLADSLVLGIPQPVPPMRFALRRLPSINPELDWLVFRIRANSETTPVQMADGTVMPARTIEDGVRVFACADRSLLGRVDRKRAKRLKKEYLAACQPSLPYTRDPA